MASVTTQSSIDLNADVGEGLDAADAAIIPLITSANIACGFHGGDPSVMRRTVALAIEHGVGIGAHVALPDLLGFGRGLIQTGDVITITEVLQSQLCNLGFRGHARILSG